MSRKPSAAKAQTNLMSGKGGKLAVKMPSSLTAGTGRASSKTPASTTAAPRSNKQWGQVQNTPSKLTKIGSPKPDGKDPRAVAGFPQKFHDITMGITKSFTPKAKSVGAPGANAAEKSGVAGFPQGAYALTSSSHGTQPDKDWKVFARGNTSSNKAKGK